jgi:hypothetical protein
MALSYFAVQRQNKIEELGLNQQIKTILRAKNSSLFVAKWQF